METELQRLGSSRSHSMLKSSSHNSMRDDQDVKYTSLKDVFSALDDSDLHDFGSSTVSIKNQLVKHAASAYLQSAAIIAARDQGSRWHDCVDAPLGFCLGLMMRTLRRMVARAAGQNVVSG